MISDHNKPVLVIFCRRPALGVGKQRLAASIGQQKAFEISQLLLTAVMEDANQWDGPVVIAPAEETDVEWASTLLPHAHVMPQPAGNLGERLQQVDAQVRALVGPQAGQQVCFIGSDSPALTPAMLATASQQLQTHDVVLIPARDGGVTLMASRQPWPELQELPWSSSLLGGALQTACKQHNLTVHLLPESYDIDTQEDLLILLNDTQADLRPARLQLRQLARHIHNQDYHQDHSLSIIIPVYNDLPALDTLLLRIANMQDGADEIIVVDGADNPECERICNLRNAHYLTSAPCRGQQLRLGAESSTGDILWFLHADNEPSLQGPTLIREHLSNGSGGGFFQFRFLGKPRWYKSMLQSLINLRTRLGTPYGDQGLFMSREKYEQAGGFATEPLFEEVALIRALRQHSEFSALQTSIGVSPRRWERDGWLRRSVHNRYLALAFMLGTNPQKLAQQYRTSEQTD
jgi:rSAM/selenodomain-associated transferase 2/rSAM/selenodomain-associated transferase 1